MKKFGWHFIMAVSSVTLVSAESLAEIIYKSVDENGNVTYSQQPPKDSAYTELVTVEPGPSPEETQAARENMQEVVQRADDLVKQRLSRNQKMFEEMEKTRRETAKYHYQQPPPYYEYPGFYSYPSLRPPYWGGRPPQHRPLPHPPHQEPPRGGLALPYVR